MNTDLEKRAREWKKSCSKMHHCKTKHIDIGKKGYFKMEMQILIEANVGPIGAIYSLYVYQAN